MFNGSISNTAGCSVFRANHVQCTLNHPTCVLIRIANIEHITADTIWIISMNNIIVHGIILIIRFTLLESLCSGSFSSLLESSLFSFDSRVGGSVIGMLISSALDGSHEPRLQ